MPRPALLVSLLIAISGLALADAPKPAALARPALRPLPLGAIKPAGWLKAQLRTQAEGLSGHLDEFWPDVRDSAWFGGKAEGWERAPYWLDGVVPLAYELDDPNLLAKVRLYLGTILDHQHADGWLGPVGDSQKHEEFDPWPLFVLFKAFTQYQEATGDPRVIPALTRAMHKIDEEITKTPLHSWGQFRTADLLVSVLWLYDRVPEPWLLEFAARVNRQAFDWSKLYGPGYPFTGAGKVDYDLRNHGVNTGMALKYAGINFRLTSDPADRAAVSRMFKLLDDHHGQATGMFTCDEHLAGRSPAHGTELCTVVEAMYSLELLTSLLGDPAFGDRLERIAFNALPATISPDMCAHQYDQQANQVVCKLAPEHVYLTNGPDANLFALEPNFGCCTANMHQGWPKFTSHLAMTTADDGLAIVAYAPCTVATKLGGTPARIEVRTDYPFGQATKTAGGLREEPPAVSRIPNHVEGVLEVKVLVETKARTRFPLLLRIPGWASGAEFKLDGQRTLVASGTYHRIDREWSGRTEVTLTLPMAVKVGAGFNDSVTIERGPLVYALKVGAEWKKLRGKDPFADYEVFPTTPWNYALRVDREHPERSIKFEDRRVGDRPFSPEGAPVVATARGKLVPGWALERNAAAPPPPGPVEGEGPMRDLTLIPYGCTDLRVTEFPLLKADPAK